MRPPERRKSVPIPERHPYVSTKLSHINLNPANDPLCDISNVAWRLKFRIGVDMRHLTSI